MSTGNKALRNAPARLANTRLNIDKIVDTKPPVFDKIDIATLEIDESVGVDCDPYNNTGQFLLDAAKHKYAD